VTGGCNVSLGYDAVAREIAARIDSGEFVDGQRLPSIIALAAEYGVAVVTVRRAIAQLCRAGKAQTVSGVGTFVSSGCPLTTVVMVMPRNVSAAQARLARLDMIEGAADVCGRVGARLTMVTEEDAPEAILQPRHGFILCTADVWSPASARWAQALLQSRAPWVAVGYDHGLRNFVTRDVKAALRKGLEYLHGLGHRRVAVLGRRSALGNPLFPDADVSGLPGLEVVQRTEKMAEEALGGANTALVGWALAPVFEQLRPTALLVGSDGFAAAALEWLEHRGLRPPKDLSVLCYSLKSFAAWRGTKLTRLTNPQEAIGRRAVEELLKAASGGGYRPGRVEVESELVEGETCRAIE